MRSRPVIRLSLPAKESIKTGLAMSLACGIALALGWSNPYWACIAVAVVSLPTIGESLHKSLVRLWGTLVGGTAAIVLVAIFPQNRWAFIGCIACYIGLCAYRITISRSVYFWFISGYVAVLIAATVQTDPRQTFPIAVLRIQETGLGILIYALVSAFVWPQRCAPDLQRLAKTLVGVQAKIFDQYGSLLLHRTSAAPRAETWYGLETQLLGQLQRRLEAAEAEQLEIREASGCWRRLIAQFQSLMEAMEIWRESLPQLQALDIEALLPDLPGLRLGLRRRFEQLQVLVESGAPGQQPVALPVTVDDARLQALPHLQRAAVRTTQHALQHVEAVGRALFGCLADLHDPGRDRSLPRDRVAAVKPQADPDSYAAALRGVAVVWLASLTWIFVDPPGHFTFVVFAAIHFMMKVMSPQMPLAKFLLTNFLGVVLAGLLYVFVLPALSSYTELAVLIFCLTTLVYALCWDPRHTMVKFAAIVPFIMLTGLQNHQTYDFVTFANNGATMLGSIPLVAAVAYFPFPSRPETMFLRLLARFFRQARQFLTLLDLDAVHPDRERRLRATLAAMQTSVSKIGGWANGIDYRTIPANPPEKAAALVASLSTITYRCQMLADVRRQDRPRWEDFDAEIKDWSRGIAAVLHQWSGDPGNGPDGADLPARLEKEFCRLENRIEAAFQTVADQAQENAYVPAYRLLGGYRGLSAALVAHAGLAAGFDWACWRETRF
jgi:uncharacterized membrane protein YccC